MSMHEFEDLVEFSIRCLDKSKRKDLDYRSIFHNLYNFQYLWDTSATEFRVINVLIEHRYAYVFQVAEHPDYKKYKEFFDNLKGYQSIYRNPTEKWNSKKNPCIGVFCNPEEAWGKKYAKELGELNKPRFYCFVNSELWEGFVKSGKLNDRDAEPAKIFDLKKIIWEIMVEAEKQKDVSLISQWYPVFPMVVRDDKENVDAKIKKDKYVKAMRDIVIKTKAYTINHDYGCTRLPSEEDLDKLFTEFEAWWFEPLKTYYETKEENHEFWLNKAAALNSDLRVMDKKVLSVAKPDIIEKQILQELNEKYKEILETIKKGLALKQDSDFYIKAGIAHNTMRQYKKAVESYAKAIKLNPVVDNAYAYRGFAYHNLGDYSSAKRDYKKALTLNENNKFAKFYLDKNHLPQEDKQNGGSSVYAYMVIIRRLTNENKYEEALDGLDAFFKKFNLNKDDETLLQFYNNYLNMCYESKQHTRGGDFADKIPGSCFEKNPYICHNAACLYIALGKSDKAMKQVKIACENNYEHTKKMLEDNDLKALFEKGEFKQLKKMYAE